MIKRIPSTQRVTLAARFFDQSFWKNGGDVTRIIGEQSPCKLLRRTIGEQRIELLKVHQQPQAGGDLERRRVWN